MYLSLEAEPTDHLHSVATKAVHLVTVAHIPVKFTLRGLSVTVHCRDCVKDVIAKWEAQDRPPTQVQ